MNAITIQVGDELNFIQEKETRMSRKPRFTDMIIDLRKI